jgi:hypothetical protein
LRDFQGQGKYRQFTSENFEPFAGFHQNAGFAGSGEKVEDAQDAGGTIISFRTCVDSRRTQETVRSLTFLKLTALPGR